ncbi:hypothetical protein [Herbiconiux liukaitaii]|uniref:hypothetical protein n=1 Tax=Herbiconiux liukaitaii TaxID=3342799 RepID=UPI0035B8E476
MTYYAALAKALRNRNCTETQVREALEDVHETTTLSGSTPESEFGPARHYAENFTGTRKGAPVQVLRRLTPFIAIAGVILLRIFVFPDIEFIPWGLLLGAGVFIALFAISEAIATLVNRRLPEGFAAASTT